MTSKTSKTSKTSSKLITVEDLKAAYEAGMAVSAVTADHGTCNFDSPILVTRRYRMSEAVIKAAGFSCFKGSWGGLVLHMGFPGQAHQRTAAAEAAEKFLSNLGYETSFYYQMD